MSETKSPPDIVIELSPELKLDVNKHLIERGIAILGARGGGKSYCTGKILEELAYAGSNTAAYVYRKARRQDQVTWKQVLIDYNDKLMPVAPSKKKALRKYMRSMGLERLCDRLGMVWTRDRAGDPGLSELECEELARTLLNFTIREWFRNKGRKGEVKEALEVIAR